jgi:glycerophosphoryl diester phosphodiesterase
MLLYFGTIVHYDHMKVIGHRGAAGLAPENTIAAIQAGLAASVDGIECDVRLTSDGVFVLSHDEDLFRTCNDPRKIAELTLKEIQKVRTANGEHGLPTLEAVLEIIGTTPLYIEAKDTGWADALSRFLKHHPKKKQCRIISFNHRELFAFTERLADVPVYAIERNSPFDVFNTARVLGFAGVDLNFWLLNPLTYWLARLHKLEIIVYTVNKPWMAAFIRILYPKISITTNYPNRMQRFRTHAP